MKKVLLILVMALGLVSCTKEPLPECEEITKNWSIHLPNGDREYYIQTVTDNGLYVARTVGYDYWLEVVGGQHFEWCGEK